MVVPSGARSKRTDQPVPDPIVAWRLIVPLTTAPGSASEMAAVLRTDVRTSAEVAV